MTNVCLPESSHSSMSKAVSTAKSCVDASTILLRLAGKPVHPKKGEITSEDKKCKTSKSKKTTSVTPGHKTGFDSTSSPSRHSGRRNSSSTGTGQPKIVTENIEENGIDNGLDEWDAEMDENTLATFRDLFNMLDQSNTGIITADNLYEELRRVDSEITYSEVEDVLKKVDKDGDGTIDFDEFLFHMTNMGGDLFGDGEDDGDEEKQKKYTRRKQLFYSAITQFSLRQTLADIEKTFRKQAPHVISHYTAGVRLIGLTTRQLERQMKKMQKSAAKNDSPYAKPLQFVHMGPKKVVHKEKIQPRMDKAVSVRELQSSVSQSDDPAVADLSKEIQDTMLKFAEKKTGSRLHDANLIMQLRQKLGSVTAKMRDKESLVPEESKPVSQSMLTLSPGVPAGRQLSFNRMSTSATSPNRIKKKKVRAKSSPVSKKKQGLGWTTPRIQYIDVPLPSLKIKLNSQKPTFNDLHRIRAKAEEAIDAYYHDLRQTEIRNAWDHWDRLYADNIFPQRLLDNFRTVYGFYSPHREEEAFVVCPWKPGPFRYICPIEKPVTIHLPKCASYKQVASTRLDRRGNLIVPKPPSVPNSPTFSRSAQLYKRDSPSPVGRPMSSLAEL